VVLIFPDRILAVLRLSFRRLTEWGKGDPTATGAVRGNERDMTRPDISGLLAYWDRVAPLPPPSSVSTSGSPAQIAREVRLRTEAARQVEESRRERGAEL
jgi:hypothetical protein